MQTRNLLIAAMIAALVAGCAGLLNLGSTNADGTPKEISTATDAYNVLVPFVDASLEVWAMPELRLHAPQAIPIFDRNGDGSLTTREILDTINDPENKGARQALDVILMTTGSEAAARHAPWLISVFDSGPKDGRISLAEIESKVDLTNGEATTALLIQVALQIQLHQRAR